MRKLSINLPDEIYKELARIKYEKDILQDEKITLGDLIRQALREWIERRKQENESSVDENLT